MKAHLIDTHLLVPRPRSYAKVKVKYQGHVSQKMGVSGALVFHKHILFILMIDCLVKNGASCNISTFAKFFAYIPKSVPVISSFKTDCFGGGFHFSERACCECT